MRVLFSKIGRLLGPKFRDIKYTSYTKLCEARVLTKYSMSSEILNQALLRTKTLDFYSGSYAGYKLRLPKVTIRQIHKKTKLAFILPNFDGAKRIGPHN